MQGPMNRAMHPHVPADVQHELPTLPAHGGHDDAVHAPPSDPDPLEEQDPWVQTWLDVVQSVQS